MMGSKNVVFYCRVAIDNDEATLTERKKKEAARIAILRILADVSTRTVDEEEPSFCIVPLSQCRILRRFERMAYNKFLVALLKRNLVYLSLGMPKVFK